MSTKWVWLSRDGGGEGCYNIHLNRRRTPKQFGPRGIYDDCDMVICAKEFRKATDFSLKLGEIVKVKITIERI